MTTREKKALTALRAHVRAIVAERNRPEFQALVREGKAFARLRAWQVDQTPKSEGSRYL